MEDALKAWLEQHGLGQYLDTLSDNDVTLNDLPHLTEDDTRELGLPLGARRRLLVAAKASASEQPKSLESDTPTQQTTQRPESKGTSNAASIDHLNWSRHPDDRRPVTLLFADITGSTALTEQLDPEDAHAVLYGAVERMGEAVERHRGTVCRFMGDGLMAMFGVPTAFEAHTRDALLAALDLQSAVAAYAEELESRYGSGMQVRVGVHAGEVVALQVGAGGQSEWDASGPAVPIAARMEQSAEPGTIQVTASTLNNLGEFFDFELLQPISVKGVSAPLAICRLLGLADTSTGAATQRRLAFVGRQLETAQLEMAVRHLQEQRRGQVVVLRGEAGVGKTRLTQLAAERAGAAGLDVHRVLILDFGAGKGQSAMGSLVRSLLGISPGAAKQVRAKVADAAIADGIIAAPERMFLNDFLDLVQPPALATELNAMTPRLRRDKRRGLINELIATCTRRTPLMVIVEDLHWADEVTLVMLEALLPQVPQLPLLLLTTTRPTGDPFNNSWHDSTRNLAVTQINLAPLRIEESHALAGEFVGLDSSWVEACIERAGGNPLFLVELLRSSASSGLPTSVQTLVATRLDQLTPDDKQAIQVAAVLGQRFDQTTLAGILGVPDYDVAALIDAQLIQRHDNAYLFSHALVMEGVLGSMLRAPRQQLHLGAANWFKERDQLLYARHLERADSPDAAAAYLAAAHEQVGLVRFTAAVQLTKDALALAPANELQASLSETMADAHLGLGETQMATHDYASALALTTDASQRCRMLVKRSRAQYTYGQYAAALSDLEQAAEVATEASEHVDIEFQRGNIYLHLTDHRKCGEAMHRAYAIASERAEPRLLALAIGGLARYEVMTGRVGRVDAHMKACLEICEHHALPEIEGQIMHLACFGAIWRCGLDEAMRHAMRGVKVAPSIGNVRQTAIALVFAAQVSLMRGETNAAHGFAHEALRLANNIGEQGVLSMVQGVAAATQFASGDERAATDFVRECLNDNVASTYTRLSLLSALIIFTWGTQTAKDALAEAEALSTEAYFGGAILDYRHAMIRTATAHNDLDDASRHGRLLIEFVADEIPPLATFLCDWVEVSIAVAGGDRTAFVKARLADTLKQASDMNYVAAVHQLSALSRAL
jgi:class 3 adenylate cyclase/tetratricopeptide (TPR) repeat protein